MQLCVSLDSKDYEKIKDLVLKLQKVNGLWYKVGFRTYIKKGREILDIIKSVNPNNKIFLDLKLYDIPNTMADAAEEICNLGTVDMFNIHASSGEVGMQTVMERIKNIPNRPIVIAVTALTSFDEEEFFQVYNDDILHKSKIFARDAFKSNVDGVVSSVFESKAIKNETNSKFITLCPGIRPFGEDAGDQKRVADLKIAQEELADFIVVGRPIYKSEDPVLVIEKILQNI